MGPLVPATIIESPVYGAAADKKEIWLNELYTVIVNRHIPVPEIKGPKGNPLTVCWLSIRRNDRAPITQWRHMQWIKNQLVGEDCEGCELFPAESRLVDTANQYHMWVFEHTEFRFPFGFPDRIVSEKMHVPGMQQTPFPAGRKPADLAAGEAIAAASLKWLQDQVLKKQEDGDHINLC